MVTSVPLETRKKHQGQYEKGNGKEKVAFLIEKENSLGKTKQNRTNMNLFG